MIHTPPMKIPLLTFLALAGSLQVLSAADITGKVILKGTPKPEIPIDMAADPKCGTLHSTPITTRHYLSDKDGGLANVFVYVKTGVTEKNFPAPASEPLLDQAGCLYEPYVMGVMVNQKFKIRNSDPTLHNVHPQPRQGENKEFNIAQPPAQPALVNEKSFPTPEVMVRFKCDVHPWMFAYVGVLDHPYYTVTGKDGTFKISGLPNGKYTVEAYHPKTHGANPGVTQEITVSGDTKADFTIELK